MSTTTITSLTLVLANTYALFLKSQNYHWHVKGPNFKSLHELLEEQYRELLEAIDEIAERIVTLGGQAPASFDALNQHKVIADGDSQADANTMLQQLRDDQQIVVDLLYKELKSIQSTGDEASADLLVGRIRAHEKNRWMLTESLG